MNAKETKPAELNEIPVEEEELTTNQEAIPVTYVAGTRKVSGRILLEPIEYMTVQAPDEAPGKK